MKRQSLLLSIILITSAPICLGKGGVKAHRGKQSADELTYTGNQAAATTNTPQIHQKTGLDLEAINQAEIREAKLEKEPQFTPGTFYKEIRKPLTDRFPFIGKLLNREIPLMGESRDVRGLAEKVMGDFKSHSWCKKVLGTGSAEENTALFSEALRSYIDNGQLEKAKTLRNFALDFHILLEKDSLKPFKTIKTEHAAVIVTLERIMNQQNRFNHYIQTHSALP